MSQKTMMAINIYIYLVIFGLSSQQILGALVGEVCSADSECPVRSKCVQEDCGNPDNPPRTRCTCSPGFYHTDKKDACYTVVDYGEKCDGTTLKCRTGSYCSQESKCQCIQDFVPSGIRLTQGTKRCKPKLSASSNLSPTSWSVYDEACNDETMCYDEYNYLECTFGRCRCKDGYKARQKNDRIREAVQLNVDCIQKDVDVSEAEFCENDV